MILITRPIKESKILADKLSNQKIQTHIEPLLSFKTKNVDHQFIEYQNYIVSSIQAVYSIKANNFFSKPLTKETKFFVIGAKVVEALYSIGIKQIENHFLNSSSLIEFIRKNNNLSNRFIYLCGNNANQKLIQSFKEMRKQLEQIVLYETIPLDQFNTKTTELIRGHLIHGVVLYSIFTAQTFLRLIDKENLQEFAQNLEFFCLSESIAQFMKSNNYKRAISSITPEQEALIDLIHKHYL